MKKNEKTNVMRLLDGAHVPYTAHCYADTDAVSGMDVAQALGEEPSQVFKTLVTVGRSGQHYVFVVPVCRELSLKKAASAVGEKSIEMIKNKELLPLTGYIHGGCSPIGMKKQFPTVVDSGAETLDTIMLSGGKIGWQVELSPESLRQMVSFKFADISDGCL